ncbi:hypothetical protein [Propionivibrio dicarboxylicus]|uniref:Protein TonB n=1 Tax=Propionivibrio dicarboxylicus TaxID=83767 RepID=A0A1G7ZMW9_9RHOO|nr:hypothetical protein [Propionivibrio dicarboxylicus]SDH10014.1 hypothetical protein SAMN05660652_01222 [Propionivibrio dicarboxylicus]
MRQSERQPLSVAVLASLLVHALALLVWQGLPRGDAFAGFSRAAPLPLDATIAMAMAKNMGSPVRKTPPAQISTSTSPVPLTASVPSSDDADAPAPGSALPPAMRDVPAGVVAIDPTYYLHAEVDVPPYPLTELSTLAASASGGQEALTPGRLVVELWIDDVGRVGRVDVLDTDLPAVLVASLEEALLRQPFTPAIRHGASVHARLKGELQYAPPPPRARLRR